MRIYKRQNNNQIKIKGAKLGKFFIRQQFKKTVFPYIILTKRTLGFSAMKRHSPIDRYSWVFPFITLKIHCVDLREREWLREK